MSNNFTSQNNDKVINIGTAIDPVFMSDKESAEKNQAHINNSGIHNSTVTNHIYQNEKPQDYKQISNHPNWSIFAITIIIIFGMFGIIVMFALSKQSSSSAISLSSNINSITNIQPNTTTQNANVAVNNSEIITTPLNVNISTKPIQKDVKANESPTQSKGIIKNNAIKTTPSNTVAVKNNSNVKIKDSKPQSKVGLPTCAETEDPSDGC